MCAFLTTVVPYSGGFSPSQKLDLCEALVKARDAMKYGDFPAAVCHLSASVGSDLSALHDAILDLLDSSSCHDGQKIIEAVLQQHPHFDLNKHDSAGKTALDLAVRHDDMKCADYLLRHGANPERTSLAMASPGMQELVTMWRLKKLLYAQRDKSLAVGPEHAARRSLFKTLCAELCHENWTQLDRALQEGRFDKANVLLQKALKGSSVQHCSELWEKAMERGQYDVLRALLILRQDALRELTANQKQVGQWLKKLRYDPGLSAVLKEFPYQSAKWGSPRILDGKAQFRDSQKRICRNLVMYQQEVQARDPQIKFHYGEFKGLNGSYAKYATQKQEMGEMYKAVRMHAAATHLIDNREFGQFLAKQFQEMDAEENPASRLMLVESTKHLMNLGLKIKKKNGNKSYVVKFYDPNLTMTGTRSKMSSPQMFETQTISSYIDNNDFLRGYYPEPKGASIIFVRPKEDVKAAAPDVSADRTLTTSIDTKDIDATAVWHMMHSGFAGNLRQLGDHIKTLSEDQRVELLGKKCGFGVPGLSASMVTGHAETVKAYGELLKQCGPIPEDKLIELIAGKDDRENPALFIGMYQGHAEAVRAYGELLKQCGSIPEDELIELLEGKDRFNNSALLVGMHEGHAKAVKAYGELLKQLGKIPEDKRIALLAGMDGKNNPALYIGMQSGNAEAVMAYGELLKELGPIPEDKLTELIEGKNAKGVPAFYSGLSTGDVETVKAYGELVKLVQPDKQVDLLLAKCSGTGNLKGKSGLAIALQEENFAAANEQLQLLHRLAPRLSEIRRAELGRELKDYDASILNMETDASSLVNLSKTKSLLSELKKALQ